MKMLGVFYGPALNHVICGRRTWPGTKYPQAVTVEPTLEVLPSSSLVP